MDAQSYTAQERRAANQVWAAAGAYGFEPLFLARYTDGTTDFYMNTVVGLIHKYYGDALIRSIFDAWDGDLRQTMLDDMTWLYLEMQPIGWSCPAARCWKRCAMPMQITFLRFNTSSPVRSGWQKISWCTPCRLHAGGVCWAVPTR